MSSLFFICSGTLAAENALLTINFYYGRMMLPNIYVNILF